jgi:D-lactate dehydrogenase
MTNTMNIEQELRKILPPERIKTRYIDRVSYGADAGFYFLLPQAVVKVVSEQEIISLFRFSHLHSIPVVFRAGGTSLSGQSITDGILIDLSQYWNRIRITDNGALVQVQPGITGGMVNAHLKKYRRKIGPDPSSINSAMMGGIISNNSSGMCCGVALNAYHTTAFVRFILPDGKAFNTRDEMDYQRFESECASLYSELSVIRNEILANASLLSRIRSKYQTKNTVGYSLNAFIDHQHPLDILAHLLVGGEGTLAFISEAVLRTVHDYAYKTTGLLYFPDIYAACQAIIPLKESGAEAVELMDRASLRAIEEIPGMPSTVKELPENAAALLVEFQENDEALLTAKLNHFLSGVHALTLLSAPVFTADPEEQAFLWKIRKGLFPAVGAVRQSGTTVILEDVAFPIAQLGDAIIDLQVLFATYGYTNAIIFGHAKDGNIHFVITQSFNEPTEIARYDQFIRSVVELVVKKYDGTLKAEHGTGRNMAPFVETEWGREAYQIMRRIKACIDPDNLLNPGVIINGDRNAHIQQLKSLPTVETEVDRCIECGYCEHRCPSRDITTTPRRRIVIRRELQRLEAKGDIELRKQLLDDYQYDGMETCALDGLCANACPVDINTGDLIKRLRRENHSERANKMALRVAKNFGVVERLVGAGISGGTIVNKVFGSKAMVRLTKAIKSLYAAFPMWSPQLRNVPRLPATNMQQKGSSGKTKVVYFPACISRVMGNGVTGKKNIMETFMSICDKVGVDVLIPENIRGACCGQIFSSKGFSQAYQYTANNIIARLWNISDEGRIPVVTDVSSCAYTLQKSGKILTEENTARFGKMRFLDSVDFLHDIVLPLASDFTKKNSIVLHPVCSLEKMGTVSKFAAVARTFSDEAVIPEAAGCCGMAGDRGFLFPELTASATHHEAAEVKLRKYAGYYSSTKTCEIAMTDAVNETYESILYLVDEALQ